jgi:hypothetical protein
MTNKVVENAPDGALLKVYPEQTMAIMYAQPTLPHMLTYIGFCCREWVMAYGFPSGRCGYCGEKPQWFREDDY